MIYVKKKIIIVFFLNFSDFSNFFNFFFGLSILFTCYNLKVIYIIVQKTSVTICVYFSEDDCVITSE